MFGNLLRAFWPSKSKIRKDVYSIQTSLKALPIELITLPAHEMNLISNELGTIKKKSGGILYERIQTIFEEAIAIFGLRIYYEGPANALIWLKTKRYPFFYRIEKDVAACYIDGNFIGKIDARLNFRTRDNKAVARIERESVDVYRVIIGDQPYGYLNAVDPARSKYNERAILAMKEIPEDKLILFNCLFYFFIINQSHHILKSKQDSK